MEVKERRWLYVLISVFLIFNVVTLSPLVPWQKWIIWSDHAPDERVSIEVENYQFHFPPGGIEVKANDYVEFTVISKDVTYGFGVFRPDGTMVFQMQVIPGHENRMMWKFDTPGTYDVRSTEYSGPKHSEMFVKDALRVTL